MKMKGYNGLLSCRCCDIYGVRIPGSSNRAHYVPLDRSFLPSSTLSPRRYDPANLPLRTHDAMLTQASEIEAAPPRPKSLRIGISKKYGINGLSSLYRLPSIHFPRSFPLDFMHLIFENLIPNLVELWTGRFKGLGDDEHYGITAAKWSAIGEASARCGATIPSAFGSRVPDLATRLGEMTAERWCFWALYLAPILLQDAFPEVRYYSHFMELVKLLRLCMEYELPVRQIDEIELGFELGFQKWVVSYERYVITP